MGENTGARDWYTDTEEWDDVRVRVGEWEEGEEWKENIQEWRCVYWNVDGRDGRR